MKGLPMHCSVVRLSSLSGAVLALAACASSSLAPPDVPPNLKPPADQVVFLETLAGGVQIYECVAKQGQAGAYEWAFRAPDALLTDRSSRW